MTEEQKFNFKESWALLQQYLVDQKDGNACQLGDTPVTQEEWQEELNTFCRYLSIWLAEGGKKRAEQIILTIQHLKPFIKIEF